MATTPDRDGDADDGEALPTAQTLSSDGGPRPVATTPQVGDLLAGRYQLLAQIGRGAFGVVFRAHDRVADSVVALKTLVHARHLSTRGLARLRREVQAAWRVTHPGVVRIYDLVQLGAHLALSMELVDGETLEQRVARAGRLPLDELRALALDLTRALAAAHEAGVTHRDLKPSNVLLRAGSGRAVITDFGLSRVLGGSDDSDGGSDEPVDEPSLTRSGELLGTPAYMAPEQLQRRRDVGPAADVYALGLVLFEAATGKRAHPQRTIAELTAARLQQPPPSVTALRPELPPALARVIDDCLVVDPSARLADARALLARLEPSARSRSPRSQRRWPMVALALALMLAAAGVPASRWWRSRLPAHDRRVAFVVDGAGDLDRALVALAQRRFAAADHRVATVGEEGAANVVVALRWRRDGEGVVVDGAVARRGGEPRRLAAARAGSLWAAVEQLLPRVAAVVDDGQPERVDAAEREAMAHLGARDVVAYRAYCDAVDEFFGRSIIDVPGLAKRLEAVIARDPAWGHPHAMLAHVHGMFTAEARAAQERGRRAFDATRDPVAAWMLAENAGQTREQVTATAAALDRAFSATPDDTLLGWTLAQALGQLRRQQEVLAVFRALHRRRPDLQFGTDLQESMRTMGLGADIPALQRAWLRDAPGNEQAWVGQLMLDLADGDVDAAAARARDLILLFGRTPPRVGTLMEVLERGDHLDEAAQLANDLLRGSGLDRALGWFSLGQIAMLQGRFNAAREAWRTSAREARPFGYQGPRIQSLEEEVALDSIVGDEADLRDVLDELVAEYRTVGNDGFCAAAEVLRAGHERPPRCLDVAQRVRAVERGLGEASYERELWRAAGEVGCAPCRDVVRLGLAPDERSVRSLFALGRCAEREGNLELAREALSRARALRTMTLSTSESPATAYSVLARYELGRVLARLRRPADARVAFEDFLAHWGHADRPIPVVDEARRALAALPPGR